MPRSFNQAGDEVRPICGPCTKTGRYCSRLPRSTGSTADRHGSKTNRRLEEHKIESAILQNPREAVKDAEIAKFIHHYVSELSTWYDLGDSHRRFATVVPELALDEPLLLSAVVALSAMHLSQTVAKSAKKTAEAHHRNCIRQLISLDDDSPLLDNGIALAAACLLRSYEILDEDVDPNRHLQGAYSFASREASLIANDSSSLMAAGFWNYLREDITFSLFEGCPLKIDLESLDVTTMLTAEVPLNSISVILGKIINATFGDDASDDEWEGLSEATREWYSRLSTSQRPLSRSTHTAGILESLPKVWFLHDFQASAMHYFLTASSILAATASPWQLSHLGPLDDAGIVATSESEMSQVELLDSYAAEICGIAFTTKIPSVLVNAFGPMAYCAKFLLREDSRDEVVRSLVGCKKTIGWPIERLVQDLRESWGNS